MDTSSAKLLFLGTSADVAYVPRLKTLVRTAAVYVITEPISTIAEVETYCAKRNITGVFTTSQILLAKLMPTKDWTRKLPSLENYAGSYFKTPKAGIEVVAINPLEQLLTIPYSSFVTEKYISKLTAPQEWEALRLPALTEFNWTLVTPTNYESTYDFLSDCDYIAVDIETIKTPLAITCVGFAGIKFSTTGISIRCFVVPMDSEHSLFSIRKIAELKIPKILQNGKYDINYLMRYNIILWGYMWDTATMMHCLYSELPKDLAFLSAFFIRDGRYWKDLAQTEDLEQYYKYNALDTWSTSLVFLSWIQQAPQWAQQNYLAEFPINFPCILSELTGLKRDMPALEVARTKQDVVIRTAQAKLEGLVGVPGFNANSPKQVKLLLEVLGCKDSPLAVRKQWDSSDEKHLIKASYLHPLNSYILGHILTIRGARKLVSTYLSNEGDKSGAKEFKGRILYSLIPHGTDTGRLASREHHFWTGLQLQNIPRGDEVKSTLISDDDFLFGEADLEQAESRDTAYIAGDENLIAAVSSSNDFHSINASSFFGIPYFEIFDNATRKTLDKKLRDLAKRVNHGANYNMGANTLIDTMGLAKLYEARKLLKLPATWDVKKVAEYLLATFHKTYAGIAGNYYAGMVHQLVTTRLLRSKAKHHAHTQDEWSTQCYNAKLWYAHGGWTRKCFGHPDKNKLHLNSYIAHEPQSLNAMTLNKAFMRVFYEIAIHPEHSKNFKLCGQIHDSILHQYRIGHEYLSEQVARCMEIPVQIEGYDKKVRTFTVPAAAKFGGQYWSDL